MARPNTGNDTPGLTSAGSRSRNSTTPGDLPSHEEMSWKVSKLRDGADLRKALT